MSCDRTLTFPHITFQRRISPRLALMIHRIYWPWFSCEEACGTDPCSADNPRLASPSNLLGSPHLISITPYIRHQNAVRRALRPTCRLLQRQIQSNRHPPTAATDCVDNSLSRS